jgi:hypothetical protein
VFSKVLETKDPARCNKKANVKDKLRIFKHKKRLNK